jgi:hypothetical protein
MEYHFSLTYPMSLTNFRRRNPLTHRRIESTEQRLSIAINIGRDMSQMRPILGLTVGEIHVILKTMASYIGEINDGHQ